MNKSDFVIIGGGIAGLMSALMLLRRGCSTTVIDAGYPPASVAGAGIMSALLPWECPPPYAALISETDKRITSVVHEIEMISGGDCEWRRAGMLILSGELPPVLPSGANIAPTEWIAPLLAKTGAHGIWIPHIGQIRPRSFISCLRETLKKNGAHFVHGAARFRCKKNAISEVVIQNGETFAAQNYILSAGARAAQICPPPAPPVAPVRGQLLLYHCPKPLMCIIYSRAEQIYLAPRNDETIVVGSSSEDAGFDDRPAAEVQAQLHQKAVNVFPPLQNAVPINSWSGLRPCLPDGMPCIDTHPQYKNLHLSIGHGRYGIAAGYAAARHLLKIMATPGMENPFAFRDWTANAA